MKHNPKNDMPIMDPKEGVVLFHPHIPKNAIKYVSETLQTRWIGQGPRVDEFEHKFQAKFEIQGNTLAVGSGTDALHLAYILAGIKSGDEVITPVFTCTATNIPLLYIGAKPVFADVDPITLNISVEDVRRKISSKTKAIICVHYGGLPCDMDELEAIAREYDIPLIEDAAHALGAKYNHRYIGSFSDFTMFSFQAIKHLTTGDGGLLCIKDEKYIQSARRLRWFGIDREDKQKGIWENDITEVGYKYQMTDIGASIGIAGLEEYDSTLSHRLELFNRYRENLKANRNVQIVQDNDPRKTHGAWLFTIRVKDRISLQQKLRLNGIESGQTHYRNDRYTIFNERGNFPNMDLVDDQYLVLPLHTKVEMPDVDRICHLINSGW